MGKKLLSSCPENPTPTHSEKKPLNLHMEGMSVSAGLYSLFFILKILLVSFECTNSRFTCSLRIDVLGMDKMDSGRKGNIILLVRMLVLVQFSEEDVCRLERVPLWRQGVSLSWCGCMHQPRITLNPILWGFYKGFLKWSGSVIANSISSPSPLFGGWWVGLTILI